MKPDDLVFLVISPALQLINMSSINSIALISGTCSQETNLGKYLIQTTYDYTKDLGAFYGGLGIFQIEKGTHDDIVKNYLSSRPSIYSIIENNFGQISSKKLIYNLQYAAIFARLFYARIPKPIPDYKDTIGLAEYYKKYYNTKLGKATVEQFVSNYTILKPSLERLANAEK